MPRTHLRLFLLALSRALLIASCTSAAGAGESMVQRECDSASLTIPAPCHVELLQRKVDLHDSAAGNVTSFPPLGYVKTYKTASTSLMYILSNVAEQHDLVRLFPNPLLNHFGWPGPFPGHLISKADSPAHQYGFIGNHGVWNSALFRAYLQPNPYFVTVLREPLSQAVSAFNYFIIHCDDQARNPLSYAINSSRDSWDLHLTILEALSSPHAAAVPDTIRIDEIYAARHLNPQSWDMGWYEFVGGFDVTGTQYDRNATRVEEWISLLDKDYGTPASVVLTEYFDEGMVLLQRQLGQFGVALNDLAYVHMNEAKTTKIDPSEQQHARLAKLLPVDRALYDHYNASFWSQWQAPELEASLQRYRQLNAELEARCKGSDEEECVQWQQDDGFYDTLRRQREAKAKAKAKSQSTGA